ncbi:hypothetical protein ABID19_006616 [Mesorhizobium robiniae]|nr:hypothetical protein [Mesorhizobium sp. ZC-5]MCV3243611.1 hypothetical protein [Mesorhizobium sp. ZC-5]
MAFRFTRLDGKDRHHLRPGINPLPDDGDGHGVQLEAVLNYKVTNLFKIGRCQCAASTGTAHFEETPLGGRPKELHWEAERYGVFVQAGLKFN